MSPLRPILIALAVTATAASAADAPPAVPVVVIAGTPATIERSRGASVCREFDVYSDGRATRVMISTTGLGDARLRLGRCADPPKSAMNTLLVLIANGNGARVCVCVSSDAFPVNGNVSGKIIASAPPTSVEAAVTLSTSPWLRQNFIAALLWGLGVAIPLLLSTWAGQRIYVWQKRKDEERAVAGRQRERRRIDPDAENRFFDIYLPKLAGESDEVFAEAVTGQLPSIEPLLTDEEASFLTSALQAKDHQKIIDILRKNFPGHGEVLDRVERKV
ncbi:MAG: hypothetical protein WB973_23410 [Thermoanaerobaculia bacterium]